MNTYLHLHHDLGEPKDEYIGPFKTKRAARKHRTTHGPSFAEVIQSDRLSSLSPLLYSPEEHIEYLCQRHD